MKNTAIALALAALVAACGRHDHETPAQAEAHSHAHAAEARQFTLYGEHTELFLELPPLVTGEPAVAAAHLTRIGASGFKPLAEGKVILALSGPGGEERFEAGVSPTPGIFKPEVRRRETGPHRLSLRVETKDFAEVHDLGAVEVFADRQSAGAAHPGHAAEEGIAFTKERQWATDFATVAAAPRQVRDLVPATAVLRARADGEAMLHASVTGHLQPAESGFPRVGMQVRKGQVLARLVPHLGGDTDMANLNLELRKAQLAAQRARQERERIEELLRSEAVAESRLRAARAEEQVAEAALAAAQARLAHIAESPTTRAHHAGLPLYAPITGVVAEVDAVPGAFLTEGAPILHLVDPDRLWLEARVPESALGRLAAPAGGWLKLEGNAGTIDLANARVVAFGGVVDKASRTVPLVFEIANPERRLKVGQAGTVGIAAGAGAAALAIPASAVVDDAGQSVVFVQRTGERFSRRSVTLGARDGDWVAVAAGLKPGERVVSRGAYLVKLAGSVAQVDSHGHAH